VPLISVDGHFELLTRDSGPRGLGNATQTLELAGMLPASWEVVQVPHHRRRRRRRRRNVGPPSLDRLLGRKEATEPEGSAFASAATNDAPGHPSKKVLNAFRRRGCVWVTAGMAWRQPHNETPGANYSGRPAELFYGQVEDFED
jgi:hypothetical protein